jgi:hypothetical protein
MTVKELIGFLLDMPMSARVAIDTNDDTRAENYQQITYVRQLKNCSDEPFVVIDADWGRK